MSNVNKKAKEQQDGEGKMRMAARWRLAIFLLALIGAGAVLVWSTRPAQAAETGIVITQWQVQWIPAGREDEERPDENGPWLASGTDDPASTLPAATAGVWVRIRLSAEDTAGWQRPGLLAERLYGHRISVYWNGELAYETERRFEYDRYKLLLPIDAPGAEAVLDIRLMSHDDRAGLVSAVRIGELDELSARFVGRELPDLLLGTAIVFLAAIMLVCTGYLKQAGRRPWISLGLVTLAAGLLIVTYNPLPYLYLEEYGGVLMILFDVSLFVLFPALSDYVDQVFRGRYPLLTRFRQLQTYYSLFCAALLVVYLLVGDPARVYYHWFSVPLMGLLLLAQFLLLIVLSIRHAATGSREAVMLSAGIVLLSSLGAIDLTLYFASGGFYILYLWKFGVVGMVVTLVLVLAGQISGDHAKLLSYSRELEQYSRRLQRAEKLKLISDMAASVAHEVRNPLQVTRGFLQLLAQRPDERRDTYIRMAMSELDRAAGIIDDYLTFAKPDIGEMQTLDLAEEIRQLVAMMRSLTEEKNVSLLVRAQAPLLVVGQASRVKQAFINMLKNSIEAVEREGVVEIDAYAQEGKVFVHIRDNGKGMEEEELARLGEPFFSTKARGAGLGLMVTYRIVEAMQGTIEYRSRKGEGTEAIVAFPAASLHSEQ